MFGNLVSWLFENEICTIIFGIIFIFILLGAMKIAPGKAKIVLLAMAIVVFFILIFIVFL